METIRNYLNTMFANMPDTEETRRAKSELLSMMEDKYNELIESGMPKNEVIGTIISEFGSLDEIAQAMDINKNEIVDTAYVEYQEPLPAGRRVITLNEASDFVMDHAFSRFLLGLGVFFCIVSPTGPIIGAAFGNLFGWSAIGKLFDGLGVAFLFLSVALGVGLIILSSAKNKEWKFLKKGKCILDRETEEFIRNEKLTSATSKSMMLALGIILCIVSVVPVSLFGTIAISNFLSAGLGPSLIFVLTGAGVFLILNSSRKVEACDRLLALNK